MKQNKYLKATKKILVFCEGKTEKIFISKIKEILNSNIEIRYIELNGDIRSTSVLNKIYQSKKQYKNIHTIFVLIDFEHNKETTPILKHKDIKLIVSKPCFEIVIYSFLTRLNETKILMLKADNLICEINKVSKIKYSKKEDDLSRFLVNIFRTDIVNELINNFTNNCKLFNHLLFPIKSFDLLFKTIKSLSN